MDDPNIDGYETYCIGKMDAYCKELEAKNGELEKKLEAVEMVHSNYVNVSCDLYSTLEKKLKIACDALEGIYIESFGEKELEGLTYKEALAVVRQDHEIAREAISKIKSEGL